MANLIVSNGRMLGGTKSFRKYIRNPEYLDLPSLSNGDEKIYLLAKIYETSNFFRLKATANYKIDWGDGQGEVSYSSGTNADYEILYSNVSSVVTTGGYKQAIITITPQTGENLTYFQMGGGLLHPDDTTNSTGNIGIVDCKMAGQNITNLDNSFSFNYGLEQFKFVGTCIINSMFKTFYNAYCLEKVVQIDTSNVTTFHWCFRGAIKLLEVFKFDFSLVTDIEFMFYDCDSLEYLNPWSLDSDAPNLTSINNTFSRMSKLLICPITSCSNITNFNSTFHSHKWGGDFNLNCSSATIVINMFFSCVNLITCNAIFPNTLVSTSGMFNGCSSLESVKSFNCINVTLSSFMFSSTGRLKDLSHPDFDFRNVTDSKYMFIGSGISKSPPHLGGGSLTNFSESTNRIKKWGEFHGTPPSTLSRSFLNNFSLEELPNIVINTTTTVFSNAFGSMRSLIKIPTWDGSNITSCGNWFSSAYDLRESNITGLTVSHTYQNCSLGRPAILNILSNLGTPVSGATITLSDNPGSDEITSADTNAVITAGWAVVL
mgnify:CR=1 FL=1|tara:strand:+ start:461 stop:2092 length:1632 start_codon:yes stop_codon:yes gene_type:complete